MRYIMLVCLLAAACAGPIPTAPTSAPSTSASPSSGVTPPLAAKGGSDLPFSGTLEGTDAITGVFRAHFEGEGTATHLGRFTLASDFEFFIGVELYRGTAVWTAANGDQIFANLFGSRGIQFRVPEAPVTETHIITGGTGRFANASGILTFKGVLVRSTRFSSGSLTGTIDLGR